MGGPTRSAKRRRKWAQMLLGPPASMNRPCGRHCGGAAAPRTHGNWLGLPQPRAGGTQWVLEPSPVR